MRIHLSEPDLVPDLLAVLRERRDCIATRDGDEIETAIVGSFADGGARELERVLLDWRALHPHVQVQLEP
jgi:hypothetical protein